MVDKSAFENLQPGNEVPSSFPPHGQVWYDTKVAAVKVHCTRHDAWHLIPEITAKCGLLFDKERKTDIHEGSLQLALALFRTVLDYHILYDQNGNSSVCFENYEMAFRAAVNAYLIASEPVEVNEVGYAYIRLPAEPE